MKKDIKPISRKDEIVVQELNGEVLIYDLRIDKAFCLNETSGLVWEACDGSKNVSEISRSISRKLNAPAGEDLVWLALDQLKKEKLIANSEEVISNFEGMSRRDVVKKIGLASVIALPVITSLIAPSAVYAVSCTATCTCNANGSAGTCTATPATTCAAPCSRCNKTTSGNNRSGTCQLP